MDSTDTFYQQLDSEALLKRYGPDLARQAWRILAAQPDMRVAGLIAAPDANEAGPMRKTWPAGKAPPSDAFTAVITWKRSSRRCSALIRGWRGREKCSTPWW